MSQRTSCTYKTTQRHNPQGHGPVISEALDRPTYVGLSVIQPISVGRPTEECATGRLLLKR
jgi:hypothetical protein